MDWIDLAQDSEKWRDFVIAVISLHGGTGIFQ